MKRSKRKTLSLTVTRDGRVVVRAPLNCPQKRIDRFVNSHQNWIKEKLALVDIRPLRLETPLVLYGKRYCVEEGEPNIINEPRTDLDVVYDGTVYLPKEGREEAFFQLLKQTSKDFMQEITNDMYTELSKYRYYRYSSIRISTMRSRWGSYSRRGVIAYTVFLAFLPRDLCEYIVVHELCHSIVFSHSPAFWELVEHAIPDYKERIQRLKQYAYVLNYFPKKK